MIDNLVRQARARPRTDYVRAFLDRRRPRPLSIRRMATVEDGIMMVRCGGGHRLLRRPVLPA